MANIRIQAVFQGGSMLPEDRFVNTFHFSDGNPSTIFAAVVETCQARVEDFYNSTSGGPALGTYLSPYVQRLYNIVAYNLTLPVGEREPVNYPATLGAAPSAGLPEEVAICLTMTGDPPSTARRRGRLYIGPLSSSGNVIDAATTSLPARPQTTGTSPITSVLQAKAGNLAASTAAMPWCIRSTVPSENFVPITGGWVDNAFDTQRRRGPDPTARAIWTPLV